MTNNHSNSHSPTTDELLSKLERLSRRRLDDQRTAMPWMVSEGIVGIGWKIPNRPSSRTREPATENLIDKLEQATDRNLIKQRAQHGLSNLLVAYHNSIERSDKAVQTSFKFHLTKICSQDGLFSNIKSKQKMNRIHHRKTQSTSGRSLCSSFTDQFDESNEIFDEKSALLARSSHSKIPHHHRSRLYSPSLPSFHSKKFQNGQVRVAEDRGE